MQAQSPATGHHDAVMSLSRLALWVLAWVATLALASFGPEHLWDSESTVSWSALALNIAVGIGLIVAHARYLQRLDELQRKIMVDAMAVALGSGLVAGCAYGAAANTNLIAGDADIGLLIILMGGVYVATVLAGNARYR